MHRCRGKVNIYCSQAIIALQATPLHNVVALRMRGAKMALEMNIIHNTMSSRREINSAAWSFLQSPSLQQESCRILHKTPSYAWAHDQLVLHLRFLLYHRWLFPETCFRR